MLTQYRWVQGFHINARGVLFGGQLLSWVDEDCTMAAYNVCQPGTQLTTVGFDRVTFHKPAIQGSRLRFEYDFAHQGKSSLTFVFRVFDHNGRLIVTGNSTQVCIDAESRPQPVADLVIEKPEPKYADYINKLREQRKINPDPVIA